MGLFERLFGQEKQEEQVSLVEEVETEQLDSSEDTEVSETESVIQETAVAEEPAENADLSAEQGGCCGPC